MEAIVIVIPAYQAEATVGAVVAGARAAVGLPVLVVDDGSTDGTGRAAAAAGATVLRHPGNQGKGAALQTGFAWALSRGAGGVLTLDADGQHDTAEIPALLAAHRAAPEALVVGVRNFAEMPRRSLTGNRISTWWISRFARRQHHDTQSGFRVYPRALLDGARYRTSRFDTETEQLLRAAKLGIPLVEVKVRTIYPPEGTPTHFHDFRDAMRILKLVVGSPLWRMGEERRRVAAARAGTGRATAAE